MTISANSTVLPDETVPTARAHHNGIANRWSPYGFAEYSVPGPALDSLFDAARWASSPYDEQPWTYRVASRSQTEEFVRLLSCLLPANQQWAQAAPVLVLNIVNRRASPASQGNRAAMHELGLASAHLARQATSCGLCVHQVLGIDAERARELYGIPEHFEAWTAMAIGYDESAGKETDRLRTRYLAPIARSGTGGFHLSRSRALRTKAIAR
jgi:hypothetical protein